MNPRLRFKKADGTEYPDWEEKKLGELIYPTGSKNKNNLDLESFSINNEKGFVSQKEQFENAGYLNNADRSRSIIVSPNSFAYNPARINIGSIGYQNIGKDVLISPLYEVFKTTDKINDKFLMNYFRTKNFKNNISLYSEGSVRFIFSFKKMCLIDFNLPCLEEQEKIGNFLSDIDEVILASDQEVKKLQELKKGAMQKIFSQEIRFKKADGTDYPDWEEKKLGEVFDIFVGGDIDKKNSSENYSKFYPYPIFSNSLVNNGLYGYANYYKVNYDCFTVTARGDIGVAIARHGCFVPIVRLLVCKPKNNQNVNYFSEAVNNAKIYIESTAIPQLTAPQLYNVQVKYPLSLEEQQKIGDFLSDFDEAISLAKQELEKWKLLKKGLLQQMFI